MCFPCYWMYLHRKHYWTSLSFMCLAIQELTLQTKIGKSKNHLGFQSKNLQSQKLGEFALEKKPSTSCVVTLQTHKIIYHLRNRYKISQKLFSMVKKLDNRIMIYLNHALYIHIYIYLNLAYSWKLIHMEIKLPFKSTSIHNIIHVC